MAKVWRLFLVLVDVSLFSLGVCASVGSVSWQGKMFNEGAKWFMHNFEALTGRDLLVESLQNPYPYDFSSWKAPWGYEVREVELEQARGFLLSRKWGSSPRVVYQLHGGAYIARFSKSYEDTALRYSKAAQGAAVFSLDYRTAPDFVHPSALEDALDGYQWLLSQGYAPENIVVAGDSAGGGLALALCLWLRDSGQDLPAKLVLSSPWTDLDARGESYTTNVQADAFFGVKDAANAPRYPVPLTYAGEHVLTDPYLSPAYGDFSGLPPMLIQTGSEEVLLSDSQTVAQKAQVAGVEVRLLVYEGMFHCFYVVAPNIPEGKDAWEEIGGFLGE